jgi:hypothetical protein
VYRFRPVVITESTISNIATSKYGTSRKAVYLIIIIKKINKKKKAVGTENIPPPKVAEILGISATQYSFSKQSALLETDKRVK